MEILKNKNKKQKTNCVPKILGKKKRINMFNTNQIRQRSGAMELAKKWSDIYDENLSMTIKEGIAFKFINTHTAGPHACLCLIKTHCLF